MRPSGHRQHSREASCGTPPISVEINFDFPADSCQQQQRDCCTLAPAQRQGRSPCMRVQPQGTDPITCNASASPNPFLNWDIAPCTLSFPHSSSKEATQNHVLQLLQCLLTQGSQLLAAYPSRSRDCSHKTHKQKLSLSAVGLNSSPKTYTAPRKQEGVQVTPGARQHCPRQVPVAITLIIPLLTSFGNSSTQGIFFRYKQFLG